ncbi:hypothetical protein PVK06_047204 [Gossypium arboreum]|uniref:RING-type E3 ubiquitin transferase n=1 Tax=Gossypium arboreum TaxID=29729 RepID=A0ABR0MCR1_GOSAR|nr:hypothetical protein PVK06_047204 [Gossypium arboreum]
MMIFFNAPLSSWITDNIDNKLGVLNHNLSWARSMEHAKRGRDKVPKSNMGSSILPLPKSGWIKLNVDGAMDSSMGCELLSWQWSVEIKHVPREANQVVDFVAKHFKQRPYELQMLEGPLAGSWKLPMEDLELAECHTSFSSGLFRPSQAFSLLKKTLLMYYTSLGYHSFIHEILRRGRRLSHWVLSRGINCKVLPLRSVIQASIVEHYNDGILMGRALAESEPEFQNSNYGMIPAKESLFKEMQKTVRIEAGDEEDCMICLEELEVGFDASRMPCSNTFHGDCIEKWLRQSHYCPICRFEMPAN